MDWCKHIRLPSEREFLHLTPINHLQILQYIVAERKCRIQFALLQFQLGSMHKIKSQLCLLCLIKPELHFYEVCVHHVCLWTNRLIVPIIVSFLDCSTTSFTCYLCCRACCFYCHWYVLCWIAHNDTQIVVNCEFIWSSVAMNVQSAYAIIGDMFISLTIWELFSDILFCKCSCEE